MAERPHAAFDEPAESKDIKGRKIGGAVLKIDYGKQWNIRGKWDKISN
jgi:hypothetical protein